MPVYEYTCRQCRHPFEFLQLGSETATCPHCESGELDKRFSVFGVGGDGASALEGSDPASCGSCGDPRGPGACAMN
ncbi:MAG: FmdB family zinc ribbon protein [Planctomycetota bacterium]